MPYAYTGKYIRFDLSTGRYTIETIADEDVKTYLLGSGYAAKLYYEEMDPSLDPLDARATLYVFNGLLSGTFAPTGCRSSWCGRSPLTGIWNEANLGGHFGAELRFAGYDGIVVTGKAPHPTYLYINGVTNTIERRDATHVWGQDTFEAHARLIEETDEKARAALIGVAGERLVKIAGVASGGQAHTRLAARGGMGALMGSKHLKAIVVRGKDRPQYADAKGFHATVKAGNHYIMEHPAAEALHLVGTAGGHPTTDKFGDNAILNWRGGNWFEGTVKTSGKAIAETIFTKHTFCHACPIGCGKAVEVKAGPHAGVWGEGPEYETLCGFGSNLQCDDLNAIAAMNDLCNRYALDTISTSGVLAFAFEAYEKGAITPADTGGIELKWGAAEAIIAMIHKIGRREDIGDTLAEGVREAARRLGQGSETYAIHVKGLELPYHDPRGFVSMAANYATASRGACHLEAISYWRGVGLEWPGWEAGEAQEWIERKRFDSSIGAKTAVSFQNYMTTYNPLGLCKFITKGSFTPAQTAELVNQALGWSWSADDVLDMGARLFNLKRLINVRLGISRKDDALPTRLVTEPRPTGSAAGVLPDMNIMLPEYYRLRKWDESGIPTREALLPHTLRQPETEASE
ncbi:MAG TPA: aldehyde ferredoxin oxidoreductase family protein [Anaerolineae bacterium]|nr:aldehyde ferredoxin oxidoreductase family protein [Anaerolineae bacterium]